MSKNSVRKSEDGFVRLGISEDVSASLSTLEQLSSISAEVVPN